MKKLAIAILLVVSACHRQQAGDKTAGAATPREALDRFMATAKAQDYDGMSGIWGTAKGPAMATIDRTTRQQREYIMMKCLKHDKFQVLSDQPTASSQRVLTVQVSFKDLTAQSDFTAVVGPEGRWYILEFKPDPLQAICTSI